MQQIWKSFPRLLEQKINQLLDDAPPNSSKSFQLFKACQNENLWNDTFEKFENHLQDFFSLPRTERSKGRFDGYLNRPMDFSVYENFHLTFRTAQVRSEAKRDVATWAHHLLRTHSSVKNSQVFSIEVLNEALTDVTSPRAFENESDIEFSDFCESWEKVVQKSSQQFAGESFGSQHSSVVQLEIKKLFLELQTLDRLSKSKTFETQESVVPQPHFEYFTQTEIDWVQKVNRTAFTYGKMPKYPLAKGPQKKVLIELEKVVILYNMIQITDQQILLKHRENIRATLLDRCELLLGKQAA